MNLKMSTISEDWLDGFCGGQASDTILSAIFNGQADDNVNEEMEGIDNKDKQTQPREGIDMGVYFPHRVTFKVLAIILLLSLDPPKSPALLYLNMPALSAGVNYLAHCKELTDVTNMTMDNVPFSESRYCSVLSRVQLTLSAELTGGH
jgi:hypothetical protein